jgi:hypothetical protein
MIDQDIIKHVIKYNLFANTRHSSMVQNITPRPFMHGQTIRRFGMSHYFVILIIDEMSSLCWEQNIDIEKIVKYLHASLNWKECLIKCAILFHQSTI